MRARVIGLGQAAAGDDGVGVAVARALRLRGVADDVEIHELGDPSALVELLAQDVPVVLVDAVLGARAGEVVELDPEELAVRAPRRVSSHGLGVADAIGLARVLRNGGHASPIRVVAVTITKPAQYAHALSPAVAAAVPRAAEQVLALLKVHRA